MTALGTVLGFAVLGDLNGDQQNALGNFLMLIAQIMETNAAQLQLLEDQQTARQTARQKAQLQDQLDEIRRQLSNLEQEVYGQNPPERPN